MKQHISSNFWDEYSKLYHKYTPSIQKKLLKDIADICYGNILDYGCGCGKLNFYLKTKKDISEINMFDTSKEMLKYAIENSKENKIKTNIFYNNLRLKYNSIDTLIFINTLYSNSNPIKIIKENSKFLKKKGKIIISDMKRKCDENKLYNLMRDEFKNDSKNLEKYLEMNRKLMIDFVPRTYEIEEMSEILEILNYDIIKTKNTYFEKSSYLIEAIKN